MSGAGNSATPLELQLLSKLGELQQQVGGILAQTSQIVAEQSRSADGRREIYDKLNALSLTAAEVERIAPLVDKHEATHQRGVGVGRFANTVWMVVSGSLVALLTLLGNHYFNGPSSH